MSVLSQDTQDLIKSALGTPAAQAELVSSVLSIQGSQLASGAVDYAALASDVLQSVTVSLTSAQVLALHATPITIVPAPGTGLVNVVESAYATLAFNSIAYTGSNDLTLNYTNGSGVAVGDFAYAWLNSGSSAAAFSIMSAGVAAANAPIVASVASANPGAGNSPIKIRVFYRTLPAQL